MPRVGIKELKHRTTQIVRDVREHQARYVVTLDGDPVALLTPYTAEEAAGASDEEIEQWLRELDELAVEIGKLWPVGLSAVDAIREQRRY